MEEQKGVAAVERALSILAAFDNESGALTLAEIARRTNLYKSTVLRLIGSLRSHGYMVQTPDGRYQLGPTLLRLGMMYQRANRMHERVVPVLERLVREGSESPSFYIRHDRDTRLCVFRVDSHHSTLDRVKTGLLLPLDCGAAGRVFLAFDGSDESEGAMEIRQRGYTISFGETDPDCAAVAAPVFDQDNAVVGVLSISGPLVRFDAATVNAQIKHLLPAAVDLSHAFGGRFDEGMGNGSRARRAELAGDAGQI